MKQQSLNAAVLCCAVLHGLQWRIEGETIVRYTVANLDYPPTYAIHICIKTTSVLLHVASQGGSLFLSFKSILHSILHFDCKVSSMKDDKYLTAGRLKGRLEEGKNSFKRPITNVS